MPKFSEFTATTLKKMLPTKTRLLKAWNQLKEYSNETPDPVLIWIIGLILLPHPALSIIPFFLYAYWKGNEDVE